MIFKILNKQTKEIVFAKVEGTKYNFQGYAFHYCVLENDTILLKEYIRLACRYNSDPTYQTNIVIREHRDTKKYEMNKFYGESLSNYTVELF